MHNNDGEVINIVFYKNRKLYCKQKSCYVTLNDIYNLHQKGHILTIVEYTTNKDITKDIIVKAIMHCGLTYETKIKLLSKLGRNLL